MSPISTYALLVEVGFSADSSLSSDSPGGLSIDFGNLKLKAIHGIGGSFRPVVLLSGMLADRNSIAEIDYEMPTEIESLELGLAYLTHCLDFYADGLFVPLKATPWLSIGRKNSDLLPWNQEMEEYGNRPTCYVQRDLARPSFRHLQNLLERAESSSSVTIEFDGQVLYFRLECGVAVMPAEGRRWPSAYHIKARDLSPIQKRLMRDPVEVSIWRDSLTIGNRLFRPLLADSRQSPPSLMPYKVLVDDNFHYQDESERYELGEYDTYEMAEDACRKIVDDFLVSHYKEGMAADELYDYYKSFGEDPFIVPKIAGASFSAWDYAKKRCERIC